MKTKLMTMCAVMAMLMIAAAAQAALVSKTFSGSIDSIIQNSDSGMGFPDETFLSTWGAFDVGDAFTITFTYESTSPHTGWGGTMAGFDNALSTLTFSLDAGGYSSTSSAGSIFQRNYSWRDDFNIFNAGLDAHNGLTFNEVGNSDLIQLYDSEGVMVTDAETLISDFGILSDWDALSVFLPFGMISIEDEFDPEMPPMEYNTIEISGTIDAVPEPATMALLGLGGLLLRRKRARR